MFVEELGKLGKYFNGFLKNCREAGVDLLHRPMGPPANFKKGPVALTVQHRPDLVVGELARPVQELPDQFGFVHGTKIADGRRIGQHREKSNGVPKSVRIRPSTDPTRPDVYRNPQLCFKSAANLSLGSPK